MEMQASKKCPQCAESIQAEALVCRFCGYDFRGISRPSAQPKTSGLAIASLVLGIVWVYGIGAILALIFGIKAKRDIDRSEGALTGRGMAIAGIVLGWVGVAGLIFIVLILLSASEVSSTFSYTGP